MMWDNVALRCYEIDNEFIRNGESCKGKFDKLALARKPTGTVAISLHVRRAKGIKKKIDAREVIGVVGGNDSESEDGGSDLSSTQQPLVAANLLSGDSDEVRRPVTKKQRGYYMAKAIE